MAIVLGVLGFLVLDIPAMILRGYVLSVLWRWFVVPLGVPEIGIAQAIGISIIVGLVMLGVATKSDTSEADAEWWEAGIKALFRSVAGSLMAWGVGAIVYSFA